MSKRAAVVEWIVVESDADWERLCAPPPLGFSRGGTSKDRHRLSTKNVWGGVALLLAVLVSIGGWRWRADPAPLPQAEEEVMTTGVPLSGADASG